MAAIITKCGYRCDLCPGYKDNIHGPEDQQRASDGWFKYFGFRVPPEGIPCDGCLADECTNAKLLDTGCPVRPCVIEKGLRSCAECDEYVCDKLRERLVDGREMLEKVEGPVPQEDYDQFIRTYDNARRLEEIRRGLVCGDTTNEGQ